MGRKVAKTIIPSQEIRQDGDNLVIKIVWGPFDSRETAFAVGTLFETTLLGTDFKYQVYTNHKENKVFNSEKYNKCKTKERPQDSKI